MLIEKLGHISKQKWADLEKTIFQEFQLLEDFFKMPPNQVYNKHSGALSGIFSPIPFLQKGLGGLQNLGAIFIALAVPLTITGIILAIPGALGISFLSTVSTGLISFSLSLIKNIALYAAIAEIVGLVLQKLVENCSSSTDALASQTARGLEEGASAVRGGISTAVRAAGSAMLGSHVVAPSEPTDGIDGFIATNWRKARPHVREQVQNLGRRLYDLATRLEGSPVGDLLRRFI